MAAMSSRCCLNLSPLLPDSNSIPVVKSCVSRIESDEKPYKKRNPKLVMGLTCAIIGLEMAITPILVPNIDLITHQDTVVLATEVKSYRSAKESKWSDKRRCPSWNLNSLETIVPENLPRPSAHRRWEAVAYDSLDHTVAPTVKTVIIVKAKTGCFSM
ncbi:hypothetical protein V2J09_007970 [Rumex salicifolius]